MPFYHILARNFLKCKNQRAKTETGLDMARVETKYGPEVWQPKQGKGNERQTKEKVERCKGVNPISNVGGPRAADHF